jgi:hypothetical protein
MSAAEAAAAPDPRQKSTAETPVRTEESRHAEAPRRVADRRAVGRQAKHLKSSVWSPFARFSSVLWLEVTGTFFALFAVVLGTQVWKFHAAILLSPSSPDARRLYVYIVMFAFFGYFTVSSFVRARRRERR